MTADPKDIRVKGLISDGLKWLLRKLGIPLGRWLIHKAEDWADVRRDVNNNNARGLPSIMDDADTEYSYDIADNDQRFADIEKNPGPISVTTIAAITRLVLHTTKQDEEGEDDLEG